MATPARKPIYRFGPFTLDRVERRLARDGVEIYLQPKTFDTLLYLVERHGSLVKKEEMLDSLWADAFVSENALTRCIKEVREALADDAYQPRFIKTVPRVGYRFIADVEEIASTETIAGEGLQSDLSERIGQSPVEPPIPRPRIRWVGRRAVWLVLLSLTAVAAGLTIYLLWPAPPPARSIAVLPFRPIVASDRDEAIEMGMAETLITRLSALRQIVVRPLSDVRKYSALDEDPAAVGRKLNVDSVLDGSIQRSDDKVRVTVRMIRVRDGTAIWADQFDMKFTDIFAIQDSISQQVATRLKGTLTGEERRQLTRRDTDSAEAYQLYLQGRHFFYQYREESGPRAIAAFRAAIQTDPEYALAYAGIADVYAQASSKFYPPSEAMPLAKEAATRALEIDDTLAECHLSMAKIKWWGEWDRQGAESSFRRAIDINPNDTQSRREFARFLAQLSRFDEAFAEIRRAQQIDSVSVQLVNNLGWVLHYQSQYDRAIAAYRQALALDPNHPTTHYYLGLALAQKGEFEEALAELDRAIDLKDDYGYLSDKAYVYALAGNRSEALKKLNELKERARRGYISPYHIAKIYAGLGDKNQSFYFLEKAFADRSDHLLQLGVDPAFGSLRSDPRLADLLRRVGLLQ
jgi:DNA-binding winged helix-turn-helix (wHTH) protein/TolB-like protein/Flp pilus assembly protein TadD